GMRENFDEQYVGFLASRSQGLCGGADRGRGRQQGGIQNVIVGPTQAVWLHAPAKEIEAEVEVARGIGIVTEKRDCRGTKPIAWRLGARARAIDGRCQVGERSA